MKSVFLKALTSLALAAVIAFGSLGISGAAAQKSQKPVLDENFETYAAGDSYLGTEIAEHQNSKVLKLAVDRAEKTLKFNALIVGEFCISLDIASDGKPFTGKLNVSGGGTPAPVLVFLEDGTVKTYNGKTVGKVGGKFKTITIVFDPERKSFDAYIGKTCGAKGILCPEITFDKCVTFEVTAAAAVDTAELYLDNLLAHSTAVKTSKCFIYNPDNHRADRVNTVKLTDKTTFPKETQRKLLEGKTGLHMRSGLLYKDGIKYQLEHKPYVKDNEFMVPAEVVQTGLGQKVEESGDSIQIGASLSLTVGGKKMGKGAETFDIPTAPEKKDGVLYLPLKAIAQTGMGKSVYHDTTTISSGMVILSDEAFYPPTDPTELQSLNDFLFYFRPSPEKIAEDYDNSPVKGEHPRIMATKADFDRIRKETETNEVKKHWKELLIDYCDNTIMKQPTLVYELRDGVRLMYVSDDFRQWMFVLSMAYQLTGDRKYPEAAWKQIEAVANFPDWNPSHHIDVGIMAAGYALAYDWMYDAWTPEQREIMKKGVYQNCFYIANLSYESEATSMGGVIMANNHNVFTNAGIVMCALAFMDDYPEIGAKITSCGIRAVEYMIYHFAPYGAWFEGPEYGAITINYTSRMFAAIESVLGNLYCLEDVEGLNLAGEYLSYMQSDVSSYNFADADMGKVYTAGLFWLYDKYDIKGLKDGLATNQYRNIQNDELVACLLWYSVEDETGSTAMNLDKYYSGSEIITMRNSWDDGQVFAGIKAGDTVYEHSHLDSGSFVFDANGKRWAFDIGKEDYNLYYTYNVWDLFRLRAESHNTMLINPSKDPGYVLGSRADVLSFESKPKGAITKINMGEVLGNNVSSAKRGYFFTDERRSLVVRDEMQIPKQSDMYWLMYIDSDAEINGNTVILTDKENIDRKLKVEFISNIPGQIVVEDAKPFPTSPQIPGQKQNAGYYRLYYKMSGAGTVNVTAKLTPIDFVGSDINDYNIPMDDWVIPEGELSVVPQLDSLTIGGVEYDVRNRYVTVPCETADSPVPAIAAESKSYRTEITVPKSVNENGYVMLTDPENPSNQIRYVIRFDPKTRERVFENYTEVKAMSVTASAEPQPENPAIHVLDGKPETRWSAENIQWLLFELEEETDIDTVLMSFYAGDTRQTKFDIGVSADGKNFTTVYSGASSGSSSDYEAFDLGGTHKAKFVKINFYGNSTGSWNSVTEAAIAVKK